MKTLGGVTALKLAQKRNDAGVRHRSWSSGGRQKEQSMDDPGHIPNRSWYLFAGVIAFASSAVIASVVAWLAFGPNQGEQFLAPGRHTVELAVPGKYLIWNDYRTVFEGRSHEDSPELPSGLRISVIEKVSGQLLQTNPNTGSNLTIGNSERNSVAQFTTVRPGQYEIIVEGNFLARVLSVNRDLMWKYAGIIVLAFLCFCAAMAIFGWAYFKRKQAAEAAVQSAADTQTLPDEASLKRLTAIVYGLQIAGYFVGLTFVAGIIINYAKRKDVEGTWLESHFQWQIRTFWFGLLWCCIGIALLVVFVGFLILMGTVIWVLYRAIKGWIELSENKPLYL
jgi:uncharacterized membrane protein